MPRASADNPSAHQVQQDDVREIESVDKEAESVLSGQGGLHPESERLEHRLHGQLLGRALIDAEHEAFAAVGLLRARAVHGRLYVKTPSILVEPIEVGNHLLVAGLQN